MPTINPLDNDERYGKPCPRCGRKGEPDLVCFCCGWVIACDGCKEDYEWTNKLIEGREEVVCTFCESMEVKGN